MSTFECKGCSSVQKDPVSVDGCEANNGGYHNWEEIDDIPAANVISVINVNGKEVVYQPYGHDDAYVKQCCDDLLGLQGHIFAQNIKMGWWNADNQRRPAESLALIHSEVSEALEGLRKDLMDDHLPHRKMVEVELADTVIRVLDLAASMGLDVGAAIYEKLQYNLKRADHQLENRNSENGKKF